jgi:hypothetical protein
MRCPDALADLLIEILYLATLRIRCEGKMGNGGRCEIEADHVHNLPQLLKEYSAGALLYYYQIEVPSFERRSLDANINAFRPLWTELGNYIQRNEKTGC